MIALAAALGFAAGVVLTLAVMWIVNWALAEDEPQPVEHQPYDPFGYR